MLDRTLSRIDESPHLKVIRSKAGSDGADEIKTLQNLGAATPPDEIANFYLDTNGIELAWHGEVAGEKVAGSLNLLSVFRSCLRAPLDDEGGPNEGKLWTVDTPEPVKSQLQAMTIFEEVAGRDDNITYVHGDSPLVPYFTREWTVRSIDMPFPLLIELLGHYGGADRLRDHLLHDDWRERIRSDQMLIALFGLPKSLQ